jgi:hypothetical protein
MAERFKFNDKWIALCVRDVYLEFVDDSSVETYWKRIASS